MLKLLRLKLFIILACLTLFCGLYVGIAFAGHCSGDMCGGHGGAALSDGTAGSTGSSAGIDPATGGGGGGGGGSAAGAGGGHGAGGGVLIKNSGGTMTISGTIDTRGGNNSTTNGGTVKLFYNGSAPNTAGITSGRTYSQSSNASPSVPTLVAPANSASGVALTPQLQIRSSDADSNYLRYRIQLYNSDCSSGLQTFDQTVSQTGWIGQDSQNSTAYVGNPVITSSTIASYIGVTLSPGTTYCWRAAAIDPDGVNVFTAYSSTQTFTTEASNSSPSAPTLVEPSSGALNVRGFPIFQLRATDADNDNLQYKIEICSDNLCNTVLRTIDQSSNQIGWHNQNQAAGTAYTGSSSLSGSAMGVYTLQGTGLTPSTQYWWRGYTKDSDGLNVYGTASGTQSFTIGAALNINIRGGSTIRGGGNVR